MTTKRKTDGGRGRRTFVYRSWARSPGLSLIGLALFALIQAGCRSDGCTNCGFASKISNGVQALASRVTKHFDGCGGGADCGCLGGESVVDSGVPVISGGMVYPGPGTMIPAPATEQPPTQLMPIESSSQPMSGKSTTPPGASRGSNSGASPSSYSALAPKGTLAQRRGTDVNRALHSTPDNASSTDLLDNLPPVDLPSEVTKNATAAKPVQPPAAVPSPTASSATVAPAQETPAPTPAEKVSAAEGAVGVVPPIETPPLFQSPGIRRYASIAPSIAGGSAPSVEGLDWLKEKGCRTFIDLRKPSEVDSNFVDAVNDRNMVYISLPIVANRLEPARLARFDDLVSLSENRPIFFCDTDGTRAGLVWYIHLRVVGQENSDSAAGKAEEIGLTKAEVTIGEAYLTTYKPRPRASTARVASAAGVSPSEVKPEPPPAPAPPPVVAVPAPEVPRAALPGGSAPASTGLNGVNPSSGAAEPAPSMLPGEDRPQASAPSRLRDPASWRPVAALVLTGIGVPLAYWSRSVFTVTRKTRARASLPGAVLPPADAPASSDV